MGTLDTPLPDFSAPPVVEVALSVQFDELRSLRVPHLGLLWEEFRADFPNTEEHAPLDPVVERFGARGGRAGGTRVELLDSPPMPRCWFLNEAGTELIQIQQDRLVRNWRKSEADAEYPRYRYVRSEFEKAWRTFEQFAERNHLGSLTPNQCEVTYVNEIVSGNVWKEHGELDRVLTVFQKSFSDDFLSSPEDAVLRLRFRIHDDDGHPIGRLHASLDSAMRRTDGRVIFVLKLTARGAPRGEGIDGVLSFLDLGRQWVVRGFASLTTPTMHQKEWGRKA